MAVELLSGATWAMKYCILTRTPGNRFANVGRAIEFRLSLNEDAVVSASGAENDAYKEID